MDLERIKFERTGGFAGLRLSGDFGLDELTEDQLQKLTDLLDELDFAELPDQLSSSASSSDEFTYTITVESQKWTHTVVTGDAPDDEKMQELLQLLNRLLRKRIRKH